MGKDVVRGVAGCAVRRDDQALFEQALAVDGFRVVFQDVVLMNAPLARHHGAFLVALAAGEGNAHRGDGRCRVGRGSDVVAPVAGSARGSERVASLQGLAVERCGVLLRLHLVTGRAVHRLGTDVVFPMACRATGSAWTFHGAAMERGGVLLHLLIVTGTAVDLLERSVVSPVRPSDICVAADAIEAGVDRGGEGLLGDEQRNRLPVAFGREVFVTVTGEAVGARLGGDRCRRCREGQRCDPSRGDDSPRRRDGP